MADPRDPPIRLQLELSPDQPGLLEGLETWLRLGLISESQLRDLCHEHLSCELIPEFEPVSVGDEGLNNASNPFASADPAPEPGPAKTPPITDFVPADPSSSAAPSRPRQPSPQPRSRVSRRSQPPAAASARDSAPSAPSPLNLWLNRLMSELSVVWLLGLGVFLVVLSSAVLAATQWARFNAIGQYLVLLAYTLMFWGAGLWCSRSSNLQLTARTLRMITLLLLPLNFWAMDGLGVWRASGGWLIGAVATVLLTLAALQVLRRQQSSPIQQANVLGLAYLHTGWAIGWMPILATYGGTLVSAAATLYGSPQRRSPSSSQGWPTVTGIAALGLLLLRALTVIEPQRWGQMGLAFGLYGATWVWLGQRRLALASASQPGEAPGDTEPGITPNPLDRWIIALGRGLLVWGWLVAIADWLAQAFGVSALGLGLRLQSLRRFGKRRDLLIAHSIAVQMAFVGWFLVPQALRQGIMATLTTWVNAGGGGSDFALLGLSLFPYVIAMVALGDWYSRHNQLKLGQFSDGVALGSNILLTGISTLSSPVLVVNLIASTVTAWVVTLRRAPLAQGRIMLTYGLGLATLIVTVDQRWPTLALARWMVVMLALAVAALVMSKALRGLWAESAWFYGLGLSALTYALLGAHLAEAGFESGLSGLGLVIPLVLTLIGRHRASVLATGLALPLTLGLPWTRLVGLGTATSLAGVNSVYHRHRVVAGLAIGYGLGFVVSGLEDLLPGFPSQAADWGGVTVGLLGLLWAAWRWLPTPTGEEPSLADLYRRASDQWGHILAFGLLIFLTLTVGFFYLGWLAPQAVTLVALGGFLLALGLRYGHRPEPITVYLAGWGLELLLAWSLAWRYDSPLALAAPTLGLGALALALAGIVRRSRPHLIPPLYTLTLGYAGLALLLRLGQATAWTGWVVVGAALLVLEIGRRNQIPPWRWLALVGLSVGWYELVIYQMRQSPSGAAADGLIILAGVAALIMGVYRLAAGRLERTIQLPQADLVWAAHSHWLVGSALLLWATGLVSFAQATLTGLALAIATALVVYALAQGRLGDSASFQSAWVYGGLVELVGWFALLRLAFPVWQRLDNWWGVVACLVAIPVYWLPWAGKGWPQRPWRVMAVGTPLVVTILTQGFNHIPTLWVLAGFYGWLAWHSGRIRVSYLSVGCAVWAIWVWLDNQNLRDALGYTLPLGLALLYVAQVDPYLKTDSGKTTRHWLRVMATGIVLLTALFSDRWAGLPVGGMALAAIAAGLWLRTRAFLYVGTVVFGLNTLNQLVILNASFPFIKWVVGILVGIALIWIAADFERRRDQWLLLTQNWTQDLDNWQ